MSDITTFEQACEYLELRAPEDGENALDFFDAFFVHIARKLQDLHRHVNYTCAVLEEHKKSHEG
jgi:hypothetical protein